MIKGLLSTPLDTEGHTEVFESCQQIEEQHTGDVITMMTGYVEADGEARNQMITGMIAIRRSLHQLCKHKDVPAKEETRKSARTEAHEKCRKQVSNLLKKLQHKQDESTAQIYTEYINIVSLAIAVVEAIDSTTDEADVLFEEPDDEQPSSGSTTKIGKKDDAPSSSDSSVILGEEDPTGKDGDGDVDGALEDFLSQVDPDLEEKLDQIREEADKPPPEPEPKPEVSDTEGTSVTRAAAKAIKDSTDPEPRK